eukprot:3446195-Rhodomonas_salina.1
MPRVRDHRRRVRWYRKIRAQWYRKIRAQWYRKIRAQAVPEYLVLGGSGVAVGIQQRGSGVGVGSSGVGVGDSGVGVGGSGLRTLLAGAEGDVEESFVECDCGYADPLQVGTKRQY